MLPPERSLIDAESADDPARSDRKRGITRELVAKIIGAQAEKLPGGELPVGLHRRAVARGVEARARSDHEIETFLRLIPRLADQSRESQRGGGRPVRADGCGLLEEVLVIARKSRVTSLALRAERRGLNVRLIGKLVPEARRFRCVVIAVGRRVEHIAAAAGWIGDAAAVRVAIAAEIACRNAVAEPLCLA